MEEESRQHAAARGCPAAAHEVREGGGGSVSGIEPAVREREYFYVVQLFYPTNKPLYL